MKPKMGCNAPWYELNISSADNCVAPCCFYHGPKDPWSDDFKPLDDYWNSPNMQTVRRINSGAEAQLSDGCSDCYFFQYQSQAGAYFDQFLNPHIGLSPKQERNWRAAIDDYQNGRTTISSTPLRYYVNFGFACNLYCTMCHQVPRRKTDKRQVKSDILLKWKDGMTAALDITVIGGEPFVLMEAVHFIHQVIEDPDFEPVQLTICTNGTMHDKHMSVLAKKRRLALAVSLDTIGEEFERIRIGAKWSKIERNILEFLDTGRRLGYPWTVQTPCMLLKTNIPRLVDFVDWTIAHGVMPGFYNFINAQGIEKTFEAENVIAHPWLVEQIPDWENYFLESVRRLQAAGSGYAGAANQLEGLRAAIADGLTRRREATARAATFIQITQREALFEKEGKALFRSLEKSFYGESGAEAPFNFAPEGLVFKPTHVSDHIATPFIAVADPGAATAWIRVHCTWPAAAVPLRSCNLYVQDDRFNRLVSVETGSAPRGSEFDHWFEVPADGRKVRLVMTADTMDAVAVPSTIRIERVSPLAA
jgi:molybdenum cofactor biosynthesis enzyme MoaA